MGDSRYGQRPSGARNRTAVYPVVRARHVAQRIDACLQAASIRGHGGNRGSPRGFCFGHSISRVLKGTNIYLHDELRLLTGLLQKRISSNERDEAVADVS